MTCFWSAIIRTLSREEREILDMKKSNVNEEVELVMSLKRRSNRLIDAEVIWQGEKLKPQLCNELKMWVDNYNVNKISNGHDTSSCDPFLVQLCEILGWKIEFKYMNSRIIFVPARETKRKVLFGANGHHFFDVKLQ